MAGGKFVVRPDQRAAAPACRFPQGKSRRPFLPSFFFRFKIFTNSMANLYDKIERQGLM